MKNTDSNFGQSMPLNPTNPTNIYQSQLMQKQNFAGNHISIYSNPFLLNFAVRLYIFSLSIKFVWLLTHSC